jgi:hypothetical protein
MAISTSISVTQSQLCFIQRHAVDTENNHKKLKMLAQKQRSLAKKKRNNGGRI